MNKKYEYVNSDYFRTQRMLSKYNINVLRVFIDLQSALASFKIKSILRSHKYYVNKEI